MLIFLGEVRRLAHTLLAEGEGGFSPKTRGASVPDEETSKEEGPEARTRGLLCAETRHQVPTCGCHRLSPMVARKS